MTALFYIDFNFGLGSSGTWTTDVNLPLPQTASRSIQPFLQGSPVGKTQTDRQAHTRSEGASVQCILLDSTPVVNELDSGAEGPGFKSQPRRCQVTLNSLRQTVHTHRASVHQAAKLVAPLLMVTGVTAGLGESNGSLRRVCDSHHLQADCQQPGLAPEPYAR